MTFRPFFVMLAMLLLAPAAQAQRQAFSDGPTPVRYDLSIAPNVETATFAGEARIVIESESELATVTMNALELEVTRATIDGRAARFAADNEAQTLTLTPRRPLRAGRHTIAVTYSGKIQDDAYGLFRVSYRGVDGQEQRALATQFEPGDARRLAPMWDQPDRRAVFGLTVTAPSGQMVISNMPAASARELRSGLTRTTFADTPSMPSYLLFMAVGDFERVTRNVDGVELGVVVRRGQTHRAHYALQAGEESLRYFTDYFGVRYPLPKLDMIGVPGAGGFGAMENWGAILYFDQFLLADENSSEGERQGVFGIIAHEIAHQWFGNLVTMAWWDDLWLNEGFASWMASKAVEAVHPEWQPWLGQIAGGTSGAMALDARAGTHPIVQTVNTIDEANLAFDTITYEKGQAVIRMLESYVGEEAFRQGVRDYINSHLYGNARTEELWTTIQAASGQPVLDVARSFTNQSGFPVLTAQGGRCTPAGDRSDAIALTQRRFALDDVSRTNEMWSVPVVARRVGGEAVRMVMPAQTTAQIAVSPACAPYIINAGQTGFFRVLYDEANFNQLVAAMRTLDAADQLGLLLDYWEFGRSGDAPFTKYLDLVSTLQADVNPVIAMDTAGSMQALYEYAEARPSAAMVSGYARRTVRPFFDRLGWTPRAGETPSDTLARAQMIGVLGDLGDQDVIAEARRRVGAMQADPTALPASIRTATLGVYASNATEADYEALLARARNTPEFVEQRRMWRLLASAKDPRLAQRTLQLVLGEEIPRQVRPQIVQRVAAEHPRMAWDFLVANRTTIEAMLDPLQRLEFPLGVAASSSDPAMIAEIEAYTREFPEGARRSVDATIATIRLRAQTINERMPAVEAWIAAREAPPRRGRTR
jgi:aminopeptidase N